jgi:hypothetical protein
MEIFCSLLDSWDNLVMDIISTIKNTELDEVMVTLLLEEVR